MTCHENENPFLPLMRPKFLTSLLTAFAISFLAVVSEAVPFSVPESLHYNLTWAGITAGEAVLEVKKDGQYVQFISRASSAKWVSVFYHVEDLVVTRLRGGQQGNPLADFVGIPFHYRIKLREGGHRRDKEMFLDHAAKRATYINHLKGEKLDLPINESALDPLSSFYYIRTLPLVVGKSVYIDVFDSKKLYRAEVQVLRKEVVETSLGTFNTILVKPLIKSEGIFHRKGDLLIWLTDDDRRIPVLLKTKAAVGSIKAVLAGGNF